MLVVRDVWVCVVVGFRCKKCFVDGDDGSVGDRVLLGLTFLRMWWFFVCWCFDCDGNACLGIAD